MKNRNIFINVTYAVALLIVIFPLLLIARYNYPSADDWSFGKWTYQALQSGAGLFGFVESIADTLKEFYYGWEGRYGIVLLGSLQPGIFGERCYGITAWIMIGGLIFSELFFVRTLLVGLAGEAFKKSNRWLWIPIIVPSLIMQILYTPSAVESFYWYNGSVNYTFVHGVSLVLIALFLKLGLQEQKLFGGIARAAVACILAVLVGGDNFATSLYCALTLWLLLAFFALKRRRAILKTWYIPALITGCMVFCIRAPGNQQRINSNFHGSTSQNALGAVGTSLLRTFTNIYSWTNIKIILMILLILPFAWMAVKNLTYDFRFPFLFTLVTFGLYASQITATVYVDGTTGGLRMAAILYYSYHVWLVLNLCYWCGWTRQVRAKWPAILERTVRRVSGAVDRCLPLYCAAVGILLVGIIYVLDLKTVSSYMAYRDWRQGWALQYAREWDERLTVLHDPSILEVEFEPLSVVPEMILYADLQEDDGYIWVNSACAEYYGKESIRVFVKNRQ